MINIRRHGVRVHWLCVVCVGLLVVDKATIHCGVVQQCPEVRSQNRFRELHRLLCVGRCRKRERQRKVTNVEPLCVYPPAGLRSARALFGVVYVHVFDRGPRASLKKEVRGPCEAGCRLANFPCAWLLSWAERESGLGWVAGAGCSHQPPPPWERSPCVCVDSRGDRNGRGVG